MKNIQVKINDNLKTVETFDVVDGQLLTIQAKRGVNYELYNSATQASPQNVIAYRVDQDLFIILDENEGGGSASEIEPDILIKDYYGEAKGDAGSNEATGILVGLHENGQYYAYVPQSAEAGEAISMLADQISAPQGLGGKALVAGGFFVPWWALAGLAGLAAIAIGKKDDDPKPEPKELPLTVAIDESSDTGVKGDGITSDTTPTLSGTGEPKATIEVTTPTGETLTTTVGDDGSWTVTPTTPLPEGDQVISVKESDDAGNQTDKDLPVVIDTTAPDLTAVLDPASDSGKKGDGITNDATPTISGTSEPGATVTVTVPETGEELTTTVKPDGTWSVTPTKPLPEGDNAIRVTSTDVAGNQTEPATVPVTVDTTLVLTAQLDPASDTGAKGDGVTENKKPMISGTGEPGATVEVTYPTGEKVTTTVKPDGTWSVTPTKTLPLGSTPVSVTETDVAGNVENATVPVTIKAPYVPPMPTPEVPKPQPPVKPDTPARNPGKPEVDILDGGDGVLNAAEVANGVKAKVKPAEDARPGDTLLVDTNGDGQPDVTKVLTADDLTNGVIVDVPAKDVPADGQLVVEATVSDNQGNISPKGRDQTAVDTTPPDLTAQLDPASDSGVKGDGITNDTTPTISGTGEPGATVKVTMPETGEELITTVKPDGTWSVTPSNPLSNGDKTIPVEETDPAGNTTQTTVPVTIDSNEPGLTAQLDPTSDSGVKGDGVTNDTTPTISGTGEPGATVKVTMPETGEELITTVKPDGTWSVTPNKPLSDGDKEIQVKETTPAGNTIDTTVPVTIDTVAPSAPTVEILDGGDGKLNADEIADGVKVKVTPPADAKPGDVLAVDTDGDGQPDFTKPLTAEDIANGVEVPVDPSHVPADGVLTVEATVTDPAGNTSPKGSDSAEADSTAPSAPTSVEIVADTNDDGIINAEEKGDATTTDVKVGLPLDAKAGDVVELDTTGEGIADYRHTLTEAEVKAESVVVPGITLPGNGEVLTVDATIKDPAGNVSPKLTDTAKIETTVAGAPTVEILDGGDGKLNADEIADGVKVKVTPPADAKPGDVLAVDTDGDGQPDFTKPLTAEDIANGVEVPVDPAHVPADGVLTVEATVTDPAGNTSPKGSDSAETDSTAPSAPTVEILDGGDGKLNADEIADGVKVKVTPPADAKPGDVLAVDTNGDGQPDFTKPLTAEDIANGVEVPVDPSHVPEKGDLTVTATVTDPAGNTSPEGSDSSAADNQVPNAGIAPTVEITEDANNDGFINREEMSADNLVDVKVSFNPDKVDAGDTVVIVDRTDPANPVTNEVVVSAADKVAGFVTTQFAKPAEGSNIVMTSTIVDPAGNESPEGKDTAKLDTSDLSGVGVEITEDANNDGLISAAELGDDGKIAVEVNLPKEAVAGDKLIVTGTGNGAQEVTLSQPQIVAGKVLVSFDAPANGTEFITTAQVSDPAGNESNVAEDKATLKLDAPGAPVVEITEDSNNDGYINASELVGEVDVKVVPPAGTVIGDVITVTDNAGNSKDIPVTADILANGATTSFPAPAEGDQIEVTATVKDAAGNTSPKGSDSAILDTSNLTDGLSIDITEDANNDGYISQAELKDNDIDVKVTLPKEAAVGDTLTITGSGNTPQVVNLTQADVDAGFVAVKFNPLSDGSDFVTTATIKDVAGNEGGPVQDQARMQLSAPGKPIVTIAEDANNDGFINKAELQGDIDITVALPGTAVVGDTLHLDTDGDGIADQTKVLTAEDITSGNVSFAMPVPVPQEGVTVKAAAWVTDPAGNTGAKGSDEAVIDTIAPIIDINNIANDAQPGVDTGDSNKYGFINKQEMTNTTISGDTDAENGQQVTVTLTDKAGVKVTGTAFVTNGTWVVSGLDVSRLADGEVAVKAEVADKAGNIGYDIDLTTKDGTIPSGATTTLTIDSVAGDEVVDSAEAASVAVPVTGSVSGEFTAGDIVTVTVNGNDYTTTVNGSGQFSVNVKGSDLVADLDKKVDASITTTDAAGNTGTIDAAPKAYQLELVAVTDAVVNVSEEGLPGGIADNTSVTGGAVDSALDTTDSAVAKGKMNIASADQVVFDTQKTTSIGNTQVTWEGQGTDTLTAKDADGKTVLTATIAKDGAYTVTLNQAVDHPDTTKEDVVSVGLAVKATSGTSEKTALLTVNIEDDMPANADIMQSMSVVPEDTNLMITLDLSASMDRDAATGNWNGTGPTRLDLAKQAVKNLVDSYAKYGDVKVNLVIFNDTARSETKSWVSTSQAKGLIDGLTTHSLDPSNGMTNYDAALRQMMDSYGSAGKVDGGNTVAYFLSDGQPTVGDGDAGQLLNKADFTSGTNPYSDFGISANEQGIWENFLKTNKVNVVAIGFGEAAEGGLAPIAYNGETESNNTPTVNPDTTQLNAILQNTIVVAPKAGNFVSNGTSFGTELTFGADGAAVTKVVIEGKAYQYDVKANTVTLADGSSVSGSVFSVLTAKGSKLTVDMVKGSYIYAASASVAAIDGKEQIAMTYTLTDNDGDANTATTTFNFSSGLNDTTPPLVTVDMPDNTADTTPTVTGQTEPNTAVVVEIKDANGTIVATLKTVSDNNGGYSVTPTTPLAAGNYTAVATATDAAGNAGTATDAGSIVLVEVTDATVAVSEEGLPNGTVDSNSGTTDSATATGKMTVANATSVVFGTAQPTALGNTTVNWEGEGTNTLVAKDSSGKVVLTATINNDGAYQVVLSQAINHAEGTDKADVALKVVANGVGASKDSVLTVSIEDDAPNGEVAISGSTAGKANLVLAFDVGERMSDEGVVETLDGHGAKLEYARDLATKIVEKYGSYGEAKIQIVLFSEDSMIVKTANTKWLSKADAINAISKLVDEESNGALHPVYNDVNTGIGQNNSNFVVATDAIKGILSSGNNDGRLTDSNAKTSVYIFTGNEESSEDPKVAFLNNTQRGQWETALDNSDANAIVFAIGTNYTDESQTKMHDLAYDGSTSTDTNAILVIKPTAAKITELVEQTVKAPAVEGNFNAQAGADGLDSITSVQVGGATFNVDGTQSGGNGTWNATTQTWVIKGSNGELTVNMQDGSYSYTPNVNSGSQLFDVVVKDGDGDTATVKVSFEPAVAMTTRMASFSPSVSESSTEESANSSNVYEYSQNSDVIHIDGSTGADDILTFTGADLTLDLTNLATGSSVKNIEKVDLTGTGDNQLIIAASDLLISDSSSSLLVTGDSGDSVMVKGETKQLADTTIDGVNYSQYDVNQDGMADLIIQSGVTLI